MHTFQAHEKCLDKRCPTNSACVVTPRDELQCICDSNSVGPNCEVINLCKHVKCDNGGLCQMKMGGFSCICPPEFTGNSFIDVNECLSSPCNNNGLCVNGNEGSTVHHEIIDTEAVIRANSSMKIAQWSLLSKDATLTHVTVEIVFLNLSRNQTIRISEGNKNYCMESEDLAVLRFGAKHPQKVTSYGSSLVITFLNNENILSEPAEVFMFSIRWNRCPPGLYGPSCAYKSADEFANCTRTEVSAEQSVHSLNFPQKYPANIQCTWTFETPDQDQVFLITMKTADIDCPADYLQLDLGMNESVKICEESQTTYFSRGKQVSFTFSSDGFNERRGFDAHIKAVMDKCKNFPCPNNSVCKNVNNGVAECTCPHGYTGQNCETMDASFDEDYLEILGSNGSQLMLFELSKYSGNTMETSFFLKDSKVSILLHSGYNGNGARRFRFKFYNSFDYCSAYPCMNDGVCQNNLHTSSVHVLILTGIAIIVVIMPVMFKLRMRETILMQKGDNYFAFSPVPVRLAFQIFGVKNLLVPIKGNVYMMQMARSVTVILDLPEQPVNKGASCSWNFTVSSDSCVHLLLDFVDLKSNYADYKLCDPERLDIYYLDTSNGEKHLIRSLCDEDVQIEIVSPSNNLIIDYKTIEDADYEHLGFLARYQIDINDCTADKCGGNTVCVDAFNSSYKCVCKPGFTGSKCETKYSACSHFKPCKFGECIDVSDTFNCICEAGYTVPSICNTYACNTGTCQVLSSGDPICQCPEGVFGEHCEIKPEIKCNGRLTNPTDSFVLSTGNSSEDTVCGLEISPDAIDRLGKKKIYLRILFSTLQPSECNENYLEINAVSFHSLIYPCHDRTLPGETGWFSSPNYPNDYPHDINCSWTISTPGKPAEVVFDFIDLEGKYPQCTSDYIE
ncbi:hEGF and CUB domain containing protein [Trichuris trichiura]|uniref:HEGF and CUB domain containing protein n=1 Tax=Trichuris trichiura TaxID=36087 RepID=A0A077ZAT4_TRITR|nr:hEGF and CUB domain containing protein [Trichuris trichiura]